MTEARLGVNDVKVCALQTWCALQYNSYVCVSFTCDILHWSAEKRKGTMAHKSCCMRYRSCLLRAHRTDMTYPRHALCSKCMYFWNQKFRRSKHTVNLNQRRILSALCARNNRFEVL